MKGALLAIVVCLAAGSSHALTKYRGDFGYDTHCSFGSSWCGSFLAHDHNDDGILTLDELSWFVAFVRDSYHGEQKAYRTNTALSFNVDVSQALPSGTMVAGFSGYTPDYDCLDKTGGVGSCPPTYRKWSEVFGARGIQNLRAISVTTVPLPASAVLFVSVMGILGVGQRRFFQHS